MPSQQRPRWRSPRVLPGLGWLRFSLLALTALGPVGGPVEAASGPILEVVRSFCLSAFETELAQSGKKAPDGMAHYACSCVADRITSGSSIASARSSCRDATSKRYPI
ncbi:MULTISPECIES: hypothetical protein [unclassified Cyanobium]|uniref:hypothetical protein n=1 Tax=unclassified Cyanobium TaxID=2627006 RepID=UPI0020CE47B8|nr:MULTISPECIES: hypothetical protein [unclassified Cyanobium]MCP9858979.1 hypothetical protein [Cyanobium sp. Cruz-8H5]MCP9866215.1 hypothetical protein [Cyanobium sp. Cruz-8D1]